MLALCLMLLGTYYAQNYAGIIGWCLMVTCLFRFCTMENKYAYMAIAIHPVHS